jgi:hypothetical protein
MAMVTSGQAGGRFPVDTSGVLEQEREIITRINGISLGRLGLLITFIKIVQFKKICEYGIT